MSNPRWVEFVLGLGFDNQNGIMKALITLVGIHIPYNFHIFKHSSYFSTQSLISSCIPHVLMVTTPNISHGEICLQLKNKIKLFERSDSCSFYVIKIYHGNMAASIIIL